MNVFAIKFGATEQALIIDKLKNGGFDVIQVSDGLLAKSDSDLDTLKKELSSICSQFTVSNVDPNDSSLSKDARLFAGLE